MVDIDTRNNQFDKVLRELNIKVDKFIHRLNLKQLIEELIATAMSPERLMKQMKHYDDVEDFFNNI